MSETSRSQWGADQLWQVLEPLLPGLSVEVVARCDSTNTQLLEMARRSGGRRDTPITAPGEFDDGRHAGYGAREPDMPYGRRTDDTRPCLLVAEHQTRGRGRMGRTWQSWPGASLTFSIALPLQPVDWAGMSLAVGVALAEALDPTEAGQAPRIGLKWPNDLWLVEGPGRGRKLGGVLIETVAVGHRRMTVVGVGLNIRPQEVHDLAAGYACLQELQPSIEAPEALQRVALPLVQALQLFEREGFAAFVPRYERRDLLKGHPITTTSAEIPEGIAEGVADDGSLRVRVGNEMRLLSSGEVSVHLAGNADTGNAVEQDAG
ncbi:MAG TPA: biotin--[acetyl-CoA-carboxylase] ligase [Burkholderiaceae bacterium]|nr:biotin--[acetyl-CoA-carboxylase] ligase [Burkholderiaceae bacterium]